MCFAYQVLVVVAAGNDIGRMSGPELSARIAEFRKMYTDAGARVVVLDVTPLTYVWK